MSTRAIVLAAGKGTRMKSTRPKVMHELCGKPMLWYVVRALHEAGVGEIVVVTNPFIATYVEAQGLAGVLQEEQLGTGHAVQIALAKMAPRSGPILIASGDMPLVEGSLFREAIAALDAQTALALVTASMPLPSNFGRVVRDDGRVCKIVEVRDCTPDQLAIDEMNAGIYAFDEAALRLVIGNLRSDNAQQEYYLTDTIELLLAAGRAVVPVKAEDHRTVLGINDRTELAFAGKVMNERLCRRHMLAGVSIVDPATTYLEPDVAIGRDTILLPNTSVRGLTTIGTDCEIGPGSCVLDAKIGDRVRVTHSFVTSATIDDDGRIGPFAQIRPGTRLHRGVHIGNFTEVKSSELHDGVKANHLAYIGDATIGRDTNIGAGTITCNYDGKAKHRTTIGENVFIGSDTMLRAPLTIGDRGATGAGSVVLHDVAPGETVVGNPAKPVRKKSTAE